MHIAARTLALLLLALTLWSTSAAFPEPRARAAEPAPGTPGASASGCLPVWDLLRTLTAQQLTALLEARDCRTHELVVTYTYRIKLTAAADPHRFAAVVHETLNDRRGWSLDGTIRFERVPTGADFTILLAAPAQVGAAADGCSVRYSCRVGDDVYVNARRWREGARAFLRDRRTLAEYRRYVVLHEVGHWLGLGHVDCPHAGARAPVMAQQSIDLDGCRSRLWPSEAELGEVHRKHVRPRLD